MAGAIGRRSPRCWPLKRGRQVGGGLVRDGFVATVTMNRLEALNAFSEEQLRALLDVLAVLRQDREIRCVVLTGAGERSFAAGADIKRMLAMDEGERAEFGRLGQRIGLAI